MGILEFLAFLALAASGGIRSVCGYRFWKSGACALAGIWIDKRTPVLSGIWFLGLLAVWFFSGGMAAAVQTADLLATLGILSVTDFKRREIPDEILVLYLASQLPLAALQKTVMDLMTVWIAGGAAFGFLAAFYVCSKGRLGFGDVKLLGAIFVTAGLGYGVMTLFLSFLLSFFYSLYLLIWKRKGMREEFPFVPFLTAGAVISFLLTL